MAEFNVATHSRKEYLGVTSERRIGAFDIHSFSPAECSVEDAQGLQQIPVLIARPPWATH